jgi:hypothetical protein
MRSCVGGDSFDERLDRWYDFKTKFLRVIDIANFEDIKDFSFIAMDLAYVDLGDNFNDQVNYGYAFKGLKIALVKDINESENDKRKKAYIYQSGVNEAVRVIIEPLKNENDKLMLSDSTGGIFGHDNGLGEINFTNIVSTYTTNHNNDFRDKTNELDEFRDELVGKLKDFIIFGDRYDDEVVEDNSLAVAFSLKQFLNYVDDEINKIIADREYHDAHPTRADDDMELITLLGMCNTLKSQIGGNSGKIEEMSFIFKKEPQSHPPMIERSGYLPTVDLANWKWWEEAQFKEIRKKFKNFYEYCYIEDNSYQMAGMTIREYSIRLKSNFLELSGYKIFLLVETFLDVYVRQKKASFLKRFLNFLLFAIAIYLTIISGNPMWLKLVLIVGLTLQFTGNLSPEMQIAMAVLTIAYGAYSTDFSTLSAMEVFQFAIKNIDMMMKIVNTYEGMMIEKDMKEDAKQASDKKSLAQLTEESRDYIYSTAYSQYDRLFNYQYDYEPRYK